MKNKSLQEQVTAHIRSFVKNRSQEDMPITATVNNIAFIIAPHVFPTATDTKLLAKHINVSPTHSILDISTGSGVIAILAGLQGARGIAVDINPHAVENAKQNIASHHVSIQAQVSDLFGTIPLQQFDEIYCNPPYLEEKAATMLEYAFFGGKDYFQRLFSTVGSYLKDSGRMLITYVQWGDVDRFEKTITQNNLSYKHIDSLTSGDGMRTYLLYEIRKS